MRLITTLAAAAAGALAASAACLALSTRPAAAQSVATYE